jgi:hypothetical protein
MPGSRRRIQRTRAADAVDHAQLQMVLQVFADAGQVGQRRDAELVQARGRADAGQLQQLRRTDRACRQQGFAPCRRRELAAAAGELDAAADDCPPSLFSISNCVRRGSRS